MSKIDEVNAEVAQKANTTIATLTNGYSEGCQRMVEGFLNMLNPLIAAMTEAMDILDGAQKEIDDSYADFKEFPPLPPLPALPSLSLPGIVVEDLDCPFADCLGMPGKPQMSTAQFEAGPPIEPVQSSYQKPATPPATGMVDDVEAFTAAHDAWEIEYAEYQANLPEYLAAIEDYTNQMSTTVGTNAEIIAKNTKKAIMNSPQALLNGVVDGIKAAIAGVVNMGALEGMDGLVACLKGKDPALATAEEIVRYEALRSRLSKGADGKFSVTEMGAEAQAVLADFQTQKLSLDSTINSARDLKRLGSGASELTSTNPLDAFKKHF